VIVVAVLAVLDDVNTFDKEVLSIVGETGVEGDDEVLDDRLRCSVLKNMAPIR